MCVNFKIYIYFGGNWLQKFLVLSFDKDITLTQSHKNVIIDVPNNIMGLKTCLLQIIVVAVEYKCLCNMDVVFVAL